MSAPNRYHGKPLLSITLSPDQRAEGIEACERIRRALLNAVDQLENAPRAHNRISAERVATVLETTAAEVRNALSNILLSLTQESLFHEAHGVPQLEGKRVRHRNLLCLGKVIHVHPLVRKVEVHWDSGPVSLVQLDQVEVML